MEAHAKKGVATSSAEIAGPAIAVVLMKSIGAPLSLVVNIVLLAASVFLLRGIDVEEVPLAKGAVNYWRALKEGVLFVFENRLLRALALTVGFWQLCQTTAGVVQVLFAIRTLSSRLPIQLSLRRRAWGQSQPLPSATACRTASARAPVLQRAF